MLKVKMRQTWWFLFLAVASYPMAVYASVEFEQIVLTAPFLSSWLGIWVFAMSGGIASAFIRVEEIDRKLFVPFISNFGTTLAQIGKFIIVMAMASIGLNTNIVQLVKNGGKPILLGFICWFVLSVTSLVVQQFYH